MTRHIPLPDAACHAASRLWAMLLALASALPAFAQPPHAAFLLVDRVQTPIDHKLQLRIEESSAAGLRAELAAWPADRLTGLFIRENGVQRDIPDLAPFIARPEIPVETSAAVVVAVEAQPEILRYSAAELAALQSSLPRPDGSADRDRSPRGAANDNIIRVRRLRVMKAVAAPPPGGNSATAVVVSKFGQSAEIRLLSDPGRLFAGADLPLRLYAENTAVGGGVIRAFPPDGSPPIAATVDRGGIGHLRLAVAGLWRVEFHDLRRAVDDPDADWIWSTATLTFDIPAGRPK